MTLTTNQRISVCAIAVVLVAAGASVWWLWDDLTAFQRAHRILQPDYGVRLAAVEIGATEDPAATTAVRYRFTVNRQTYTGEFTANPDQLVFLRRTGLLPVAYSARDPALFVALADLPRHSNPERLERLAIRTFATALALCSLAGFGLCWLGWRRTAG